MGAMVGSTASGVYKAAISQSPVTDWRYYGQCACTIRQHTQIMTVSMNSTQHLISRVYVTMLRIYLQTQFTQSATWACQMMKAIPMR